MQQKERERKKTMTDNIINIVKKINMDKINFIARNEDDKSIETTIAISQKLDELFQSAQVSTPDHKLNILCAYIDGMVVNYIIDNPKIPNEDFVKWLDEFIEYVTVHIRDSLSGIHEERVQP
jgi:hypothetical protein